MRNFCLVLQKRETFGGYRNVGSGQLRHIVPPLKDLNIPIMKSSTEFCKHSICKLNLELVMCGRPRVKDACPQVNDPSSDYYRRMDTRLIDSPSSEHDNEGVRISSK